MGRKQKSLKTKIILRLFFITFVIFALTELFLIQQNRRSLNRSLDDSLLAHAEGLVSITDTEGNGKIYFEFLDEFMPEYSGPNPSSYFLIRRLANNSEIQRSDSLKGVDLVLPEFLSALSPHNPVFWNGWINGKKIRFVALRELARPETGDEVREMMILRKHWESEKYSELVSPLPHEYILVVGLDTIDVECQFAKIIKQTSITLGAGLIILLLFGGIVLFYSLKPLSRLEHEVKSISEVNFIPVTVPEVREIAEIARTLNASLHRLKDAFEREKRFTADVAHELRTPLSEIRSLAEVALKWDDKLDEYNRTNYQDILDSVIQMQKIVVTLLALARCDASTRVGQKEKFSFEPVINAVWEQYRKKSSAKEITCRSEISRDMNIFSDKVLINSILENLFSNAVDYTPDGGVIEWKAGFQEDKFFFNITNTVTDLTAQDLPHLFEPFWRKDTVRTSNGLHSGLGLSTVRSFATAIGLSITAIIPSPGHLLINLSE